MKKNTTEKIIEKIEEYTLEEIMGERFGQYSKYIIQDRAIPDVRDGLKPVQRRILYSMYREKHTYDKPYVKSARCVGDIMGKYHPHGDSSIYEAMVRMSQWWKQNTTYIDMHGNNGSMDGDSPAAMRYTEARLSKISHELLKDIDKDTITWAPNFDDTLLEPTVLPARFPNLLVNGTTGISAGYATNIPPHNLGEVIDATIKRIDSPNCTLDTIMNIIKGPDFPTGGIALGLSSIRAAFEKGRGKVVVRARTSFEEVKGKLALIVTEIPFEVNKAQLVRKIDEIRIDKKIDGIVEVRDESDKDGLRIAIDLKKDANRDLILNYLLKNTDLQISYSYNMVAIDKKRPRLLGVLDMLDAYVTHQREVITKRTRFDLEHAKARLHIVEGLIYCLSILDEVIRVIRASKNKADAKVNLVKEFNFSEDQAEAILVLQLYRLTNMDVTQLEEELANLKKIVQGLEAILQDENMLKNVMKEELRKVKKEFATPRKTTIEEEVSELKIELSEMIPKEEVVVFITKDGYIKRSSMRSFASTNEDATMKEGDYALGIFEMNTIDTLLVFTSKGNYLYIPVHTIFDMKWKDLGKHISNLIKLEENEEVISALPVYDFSEKREVMMVSRDGMIKRTLLSDFKVQRYSKALTCMKLKGNDQLVDAFYADKREVFLATRGGYGLWFDKMDVPVVGAKTSGVKAMNLKGDVIVSASNFTIDDEYITVVLDKGTAKRVRISDFDKQTRARRGLMLVKEVKTNPYHVVKALILNHKEHFGIKNDDISILKPTDLPIMDRYSTGSAISKKEIVDAFRLQTFTKKEEIKKEESEEIEILEEEEKPKVSLKEIDERLMTIDDFKKIERIPFFFFFKKYSLKNIDKLILKDYTKAK